MSTAAPFAIATHPLTAWTGELGLPDFTAIRDQDFVPAFEAAFAEHAAEMEALATDDAVPTIANSLEVFELSGEALARVSAIFWCLAGAHTNETIQTIEREIAPKMSRHYSSIYMDERLFRRFDGSTANAERSTSTPRPPAFWKRPGSASSGPVRSWTQRPRRGSPRSARNSRLSAQPSARTCWPTSGMDADAR